MVLYLAPSEAFVTSDLSHIQIRYQNLKEGFIISLRKPSKRLQVSKYWQKSRSEQQLATIENLGNPSLYREVGGIQAMDKIMSDIESRKS